MWHCHSRKSRKKNLKHNWHLSGTTDATILCVCKQCSVSCGVGIQKRAVSCRAVAREGWLLPGQVSQQACNETEKPESERTCSYSDCQLPYRWETTPWSAVGIRPTSLNWDVAFALKHRWLLLDEKLPDLNSGHVKKWTRLRLDQRHIETLLDYLFRCI